MNWTGGHLSRRSRGGAAASLNHRQKAHFAKVQNNLRNATKKRPIKWSIFGRIQVQQADQERQSSLEPRARRESSLPVTQDRPRYIEKSYPRSRDRHPTQCREAQHIREPTPGPVKGKHTPSDDLCSATPRPVRKRKRESFVSGNEAHGDKEVDFISKKRQRLLEKGDWVGITYQRPLQMTFTSPRHADNIGRRKTITDGHQAQYASRESTLLSPFVARARPPSLQNFDERSQRGKTDVRIHIGDRVVPPGISSSTAPSRITRGHSIPRRIREKFQAPSSDVMLLDNDEVLRGISPHGVNETPFDDRDAEVPEIHSYQGSIYPENGHFGDERDSGDHQSDRDGQSGAGEDDQYFGDDYESAQDYHNHSSMEADTRTHIPERSVSPIAVGTPFSPTLIKHPIPQSSRVSLILRSDSSEVANSTVAQVGKGKSIVPSSQVLDNEIWETWMAPLFNEEPFKGQSDEENVGQERSISPGISTAPGRRIRHPASRLYQKRNVEVEDGRFSKLDKASRMVNPSIPDSSSTEDQTERRKPPRNVLRREIESHRKKGRVEEPMQGVESLNKRNLGMSGLHTEALVPASETQINFFEFPPSDHATAKHSLQAQSKSMGKNEENPDDLWRKFVFGSDETDQVGGILKSTQSLGTLKTNASASSVRGNPSTGTSANSPAYSERQSQNTPHRSDCDSQSHTPKSRISINSPTYTELQSQNTPHRSGPQSYNPSTVSHPDTNSTDVPWDPPTGLDSGTYIYKRRQYQLGCF